MLQTSTMWGLKDPAFSWGFCPKNRKNGPKVKFLNLLKNLLINFSILSAMKLYINYYIAAQIACLEKIWGMRYGLKCTFHVPFAFLMAKRVPLLREEPRRLQDFEINYILKTKIMKKHDFLHVDNKSFRI